jgi:hypothetical protein
VGLLSPDGFTQNNPIITATPSTRLAGITSKGVLGGSIAFTRPDAGNGYIGGAIGASLLVIPLGIFINDAVGNAFENTPGAASGRAPYYSGMGCFGVSLWETQNFTGGAALTYSAGDKLYASRNGLLTNVMTAANTYEMTAGAAAATLIAVVKVAPDADNSLMVIDLRI